MNRYYITQPVYMVASNRIIQPVTVRDNIDDMYLVYFERAGSLWLHESRLFPSQSEAARYLKEFKDSRKDRIKNRDRLR